MKKLCTVVKDYNKTTTMSGKMGTSTISTAPGVR